MDYLVDWFSNETLLGLPLDNVALALVAGFASYLLMTVSLRWVLRRADAVASHTSNQVDDVVVEVLRQTKPALIALAALLIGLGMLELPERWAARVSQLWFVALMVQAALWCNNAVGIFLHRHDKRRVTPGAAAVSASATLLSWGLRTILWTVVALAILSNMGVNITAFVASLGVGGIAVALAVQNILGDLFASLAIALDKPFEVGDAIAVNGVSGTVEHVGLKTTRIRASGGEQIVMSNTDLLKNAVSNYKRLAERRVVFKFGLHPASTPGQAAAIPAIVERIVRSNGKLRFDRAHLQAIGPNSLDYEVVYIVLDASYQLHMDSQQALILQLMREVEQLGARFAFPAPPVVVEGSSDALDMRPEPARPQAAPNVTAARPRPRMVPRPEPG